MPVLAHDAVTSLLRDADAIDRHLSPLSSIWQDTAIWHVAPSVATREARSIRARGTE